MMKYRSMQSLMSCLRSRSVDGYFISRPHYPLCNSMLVLVLSIFP
jgi:hypothetical protein